MRVKQEKEPGSAETLLLAKKRKKKLVSFLRSKVFCIIQRKCEKNEANKRASSLILFQTLTFICIFGKDMYIPYFLSDFPLNDSAD